MRTLTGLLAALVAIPVVSDAIRAQAPAGRAVATASVAAASSYSPPRTPWGDPDLQGNYTNTYENGTPFERPKEFEGRRLEDVKGEELSRIRRAIQERTIAGFQGPIHAPDHWWQDNLDLHLGSQAWLVVDPPDGRIPPMTAEAQQRIAARNAARKQTQPCPVRRDGWKSSAASAEACGSSV
jgi:hypothetical protein